MAGIVLSQGAATVLPNSTHSEDLLLSKQQDAVLVLLFGGILLPQVNTITVGGVSARRATDGTSLGGALLAGGPQTEAWTLPLSQLAASGKQTLSILRGDSTDIVFKWYVVAGVLPAVRAVHNQAQAAANNISVNLTDKEENDCVVQVVAKKLVAAVPLTVSSPFKQDGVGEVTDFGGAQAGFAHYAGEPPDNVSWQGDTSTAWNSTTLFFSSSTPNALTEETQHFEDGLRSLAGPFWGKPRIAALLRSYLRRTQEEEAAYWQVLRAFHPETATGVALELLGKIVGQPKLGFTEDEHRALIRGRIRTNRSFGGHQDLLEIIQAVALTTAPTHIYQLPFMTVYVVPEERLKESEAAAMLVLLPDGRAAGVRMFVMLAYETTSEPYDYSDLGLLFSDSIDPSTTPGAAWFDTRQV